MKIEEFIEGYKNATNKENYVKKHIVNDYVSYATKVDECAKILNVTSYRDGVLYQNTPSEMMFVSLLPFKLYTDIEFEFNVDSFDLFDSNELIDMLAQVMPSKELIRLNEVYGMVKDDISINNRDIVPYIEKKIKNLSTILELLERESDGETKKD